MASKFTHIKKLSALVISMFICSQGFGATNNSAKNSTKQNSKESTKETNLQVIHPKIGTSVSAKDGSITLTLIDKRQNYAGGATRESAIYSPKSVNIHPDGSRYYVNSLEGGTTIVFDAKTNNKIASISHNIGAAHDNLWSEDSGIYKFTHYPKNNHFKGKPVESTFSHNGRYLWVPYYKRSYDLNAQDPSAVAVIDTQSNKIIKLMETGTLPKMITTTPNGKMIAISHWGDNTIALIDISSDNPNDWKHIKRLVVDYILPLNYPLDKSVDRDTGSGYALRGMAFSEDSRYMLIGCMGGGGGIAIIDLQDSKYLGRVLGMMPNVRHLVVKNGYLYLSINKDGYVQKAKMSDFIESVKHLDGKTKQTTFKNWQNAKVGAGARTIALSPDGKYIFVACNSVSKVAVVDSDKMVQILQIDADSFPVGLDVSADGKFVYTTSQGKAKYGGGNAVDIYRVDYK
ncbi:YncE family protein [Helicobacter jaachi]|nr:beta-propeller fold lactonase family protein [Helicobacter jaachi]